MNKADWYYVSIIGAVLMLRAHDHGDPIGTVIFGAQWLLGLAMALQWAATAKRQMGVR